MSIEETIAAAVRAELAPLLDTVSQLSQQVESLQRALPPQLVTIQEAAKRLGISVSSVRRRLGDGSLPCRRVGRAVRVDVTGLHAPTKAEVVRLAHRMKAG